MQQHTVQTPYVVGEVHFYSTELNGDLVLFDTGPPTEAAKAYLKEHLDLDRLRHVFITHCHVDHYGLASYLAENTAADIYLPRKDALKIAHYHRRLEGLDRVLLEIGFDTRFLDRFRQMLESQGAFPTLPRRFKVVEQTDTLEQLGISFLNCPGHCQSDLIYLVEDFAITGDTLLRGIFQTPLLDVDLDTFSGRFGNYEAYCDTLVRMKQLSGRTILPGHRQSLDSLEATIVFYVGKLLERAGRVRECAHGDDVSAIVRRLFGPDMDDPFFTFLKASEVVFIRDFFNEPDRLRQAVTKLGLFDQLEDAFSAVTPQGWNNGLRLCG